MNLQIIRQATRLFPASEYSSRRSVKHLRRGWMRSVKILGDKWILAKQVQRHADSAVLAVVVVGGWLPYVAGWPV